MQRSTTHQTLFPQSPLELVTNRTLPIARKLQMLDNWEHQLRQTPFGDRGMLQQLLGALVEIRRARQLINEKPLVG